MSEQRDRASRAEKKGSAAAEGQEKNAEEAKLRLGSPQGGWTTKLGVWEKEKSHKDLPHHQNDQILGEGGVCIVGREQRK